MSLLLIIILASLVAILLIVGVIKASIWLTSRKEASSTQAWFDSSHCNADGYGSTIDLGCGADGGGCD